MKICYKDKTIRRLCEEHAIAEKKLGAACARKLKVRLSALEAASRVSELVAGNPHPLKGSRKGQFALDLSGGRRLTFISANDPHPVSMDGSIDWPQVTIISIEYIGDYHD